MPARIARAVRLWNSEPAPGIGPDQAQTMTYGVDQCRMCGKPIPVLRPTAWREWEDAQRRPVVPEKEWRRLGMLGPPTRLQWRSNMADGCCTPCGVKLLHRRWRYGLRGVLSVAFFVGLAAVVSFIILYFPH